MAQVFMLIELETNDLVSKKHYTDGRKAAKVAQRLTALTKRKYQVRKVDPEAGDPNWRERESARFDNGEYLPVTSFIQSMAPVDTFPHIAKKNPALIAYTKDEYKGRIDRQSLLSIEAFIDLCLKVRRKYDERRADDGGYDSVEEMYARRYGPDWKRSVCENQLRIATDATTPVEFIGPVSDPEDTKEVERIADAIEEAYTNYAASVSALEVSCMRYDAENFGTRGIHPVRAYASPDLALAVIRDKRGKTTARAICWPKKKIYNRIYSDSSALDNALKALGYSRDGYYGGSGFNGARMRRIERDDYYIMPYLDGDHSVDVTEDWIVWGGSDGECERTDGRLYVKGEASCDHCGDGCGEDDMVRVHMTSSRQTWEMWCQSCADNDAFYCNGYDVYFSNSVDYSEVNVQTYSDRYLENNANWCEHHEEWTFDSVHRVIINDHGDTQRWSPHAIQDYAYEFDGRNFSNDVECVTVVTERYVKDYGSRRIIGTYTYQVTNVWYGDETIDVPEYLIDNGSVDAYEGVDGRWYMRDYIDHYPVDRPRVVDVNFVPQCWAFDYLTRPQPTLNFGERMAELRALREMVNDTNPLDLEDICDIYNELFVNE
jgi:hypothetical protein